MAADQIKNLSRELGFNWKNALLLTVLGLVLGAVFAFVIPLHAS